MAKISMKYLVATIVVSFILTASVYYGGWPNDYESWDANKKMDYLWNKVMADTKSGAFPNPFGLAKLAAPEWLGGLSLMIVGTHPGDQLVQGRYKGIHSVGLMAKGRFRWEAETVKRLGLTGGFTEENELLIRFSSAAKPESGATAPNIAIKHLRNGVESGNLFGGHGLKPQPNANYFYNPLANHVPNVYFGSSVGYKDKAQALLVNYVFQKGPLFHGITGTAAFAQYTSDGKRFDNVRAPFTLIYNPNPALTKQCEGSVPDGQAFGCLSDIEVGTTLFEMYCVMEPKEAADLSPADVHYLGTLESTTKMTRSKFGDEQLFFRHNFWDDELAILKNDWKSKVSPVAFMDVEGPEKYRKFLNKARRMRLKKKNSNH